MKTLIKNLFAKKSAKPVRKQLSLEMLQDRLTPSVSNLLEAVHVDYSISEELGLVKMGTELESGVSMLDMAAGPQDPIDESHVATVLEDVSILDMAAGPQEPTDESLEATVLEDVSILDMAAGPQEPIDEFFAAAHVQTTPSYFDEQAIPPNPIDEFFPALDLTPSYFDEQAIPPNPI